MIDLVATIRQILGDLHPDLLFPKRIRVGSDRIEIGEVVVRLGRARGATVVGLGKAAVPQVRSIRRLLADSLGPAFVLPRGFALTKVGHGSSDPGCEVVEAAHPVPDDSCRAAASELIWRVRSSPPDHLLIVCLSGGGSALAISPRPPFSVSEKIRANSDLLASGASIVETNLIRREMSAIKNGGLLATAGARQVLTLITSDVPVDDLAVVASGPTMHRELDPDAVRSVAGARLSPALSRRIEAQLGGSARRRWNSYLLTAATKHSSRVACVGAYETLIDMASRRLRRAGVTSVQAPKRPFDLSIEAGVTQHIRELEGRRGHSPPWALVTGGELPVRVRGSGRGGRNTEFVLRMAQALWSERLGDLADDERERVTILAVGTDGSDGPTDAAGGWMDRRTFDTALSRGLSLDAAIASNDSLTLLESLGCAIRTGPTHTNLMDLRIVLVQ